MPSAGASPVCRLVRSSTIAAFRAEASVGCRVRTPDTDRLCTVLDAAGHSCVHEGGELIVDTTPERVGEVAAAHGVVLHALSAAAGLEHAFFQIVEQSGSTGEPAPVAGDCE